MKKILIIDDDKTFHKVMGDKLDGLGYKVASAFDGIEGLNLAVLEKPDLVLLDIRMPKLDGLAFLKQLRAKPDAPKMPILITSNLTSIDKISEGISLGVKGYIIKSNETLDSIVKEIETALNPEKKIDTPITPVP